MRRNADLADSDARPPRDIWSSIDNLISKRSTGADLKPARTINLWERLKEKVDFASSKPQKAGGIVERRLESDREGEYYILKNPRAGTYLKLTDRDFYLWSLMDGTRSVKDLVIAYFSKYNSFAFARVGSLVTQLRNNLFLTDQSVNTFDNLRKEFDKGTFKHRADTFWKSFLHKEFALHEIDRYITKAYRTVGWIFFTKPMQILYLILSGLGAFFFIKQLNSGSYPILRTWNSYGLGFLTVLIIYLAIVAIHETVHAFAVKSYGRDIRKGGFLIYFGMPAFFVDTMDIWMEPRRARMVVSWAGPYSQLISGGLCSIIAAFFPGTVISSLLFKFAFFSYLSVFINLNPLLEMDGYFILMDYLEIPLLRRKSLTFVRKDLWPKLLRREKFSRDERIFTVFGVLAGIWSICAISIAVYLWQQRIFSALAGILEKGVLHKLYLGAIVLIFGVPLVVVLAMKVSSIIYAAFVWIADNRYLKTNSNLIALLVGISIGLAIICYFTPEAKFQIYKDIFKLMVLLYALFFAVRNIVFYREGRLGSTFELLAVFIFFLFIADLVGSISLLVHGSISPLANRSIDLLTNRPVDLLNSAFRIGAYGLLLLSMAMLAGKNIRLCRWNEKLVTLVSLTASGSLIFIAIRWALQSEVWRSDPLPMLNFLLPMVLVSLAFVLLIPSCFIYQRTGFLIAWLVLVMSLVGMSTANILRFYEGSYIETALQTASRSATSFYVLSYALLASALFSHYIIYTRVRSNHAPAAGEVGARHVAPLRYDDKQRLRSAFANICECIFSQFMSIYGERVTRYVQDKLNTLCQEAGWRLKAVSLNVKRGTLNVEIEDNVPEEFNIISLGEVYRGFLSQMRDLVSNMAGKTFVEKAMERSCDRLYWEEREVADEYLISPLKLSKKLTEEFRMAKRNLQSMLQGVAIFSDLSQEENLLISSRLQTEKFRGGTEIVKQGDLGDKLYIIKSGRVEVLVRDSQTDGTERVVAHLSEGDYFGEIALLADMPRTATCRATTPVEVWVLSKRDFNQLVRGHFDLSEKLDRAVANMTMLKRMPLFRELTYKQINMILSRLKSKTVPAQTAIIRQGEPGDAFYIIRSGEVVVTAMSGAGEKVLAELGEAEYFGEIALVTDRPRIANVTSVSETELLIMEKSDFDAVVKLVGAQHDVPIHLEQAGSRRLLDTRRKLGMGSEESKEHEA